MGLGGPDTPLVVPQISIVELEKSQRSQISSVNADVEALRRQYL